jgi:hypothetical protein
LKLLTTPNLEVRRHNIVTDDLPERAFNLVHERMVLAHLPERDTALQRMVSALKPGGWLLCEEMDNVSAAPVSSPDVAYRALYTKIEDAVERVMTSRGHVYDYDRRLYGLFQVRGLTALGAEGRVALRYMGARAEVAWLTAEQLKGDIISGGYAIEEEIQAYFVLLNDPAFFAVGATLFAVWGRRAEESSIDSG